mgnify:FL=1
MKKEKKDQFIIAYITDFDRSRFCVEYAVQMSRMLGKGLILLHISDRKRTMLSTNEAETRLKELNDTLPEDIFHSYAALQGRSENILNAIGELLNAVMLVVSCNPQEQDRHKAGHPKTLLADLASCRIAYLVCPEQKPQTTYAKVLLTLNYLRESKEKTLWASYFGRFASSEVFLYYRRYKDEYYQRQLNLNIGFARKMFEQFGIAIQTIHSSDTKTELDIQALDYAEKENCNLIICQTSKNKTFIDTLRGLEEVRVLKRLGNIPILFLNPREDLFILCE